MFLCVSSYSRPLTVVDASVIEAHHAYLREAYARGLLLCSGPQVPRTGGVIVALGGDEAAVRALVDGDPLVRAGLTHYTLTRFVPTKAAYPELVEPSPADAG
ncbi:YciI family protein [Streptomyces sp. NPDC091217]|uniref:YciI family protein n=1 Tax=Streptomyces sp. NPDC091217 TaxID=3365975 RepID=UPI003808DF7C